MEVYLIERSLGGTCPPSLDDTYLGVYLFLRGFVSFREGRSLTTGSPKYFQQPAQSGAEQELLTGPHILMRKGPAVRDK